MFDHLCQGRYIMGVGPGGLGSDFELFKTFDKNRSEMMVEAVEIIHKIWASDPPYRIPGKYWDITIDAQYQPHLGVGPMLKPYQKPYPPLAVSAMSPASRPPGSPASAAGGWSRRISCPSAMPRPTGSSTAPGAEAAGRRPDRAQWRLARSILVTETTRRRRTTSPTTPCSFGWYYTYLRDNLATYKLLKIFKPTEAMPDEEVTVQKCLEVDGDAAAAPAGCWTSSWRSSTRSARSAPSC